MQFNVDELIHDLRSPAEATRRTAAQRLALMRNPVAIDALVTALSDQSTPVTMAAVHALAQIGAEAIPAVTERLLDDDDSSVRYAATMVFSEMRHADAVPVLVDALRDTSEDVQSGAALALENIGTSEALAEVLTWRKKHSRN